MTDSAAYLDEVRAALADLPPAAQRAALAEARDALADGGRPDQLGSPAEFAAGLRDVFAPTATDAQGEAGGMPFEFRSATDERVRSRIWDPADARLVVPRLFGGGWTLNLGAVAVRLGLIRPDDYDDDVVAAIPDAALLATRNLPVALAVATLAAAASAWGRAERVPANWGLDGRPTSTADARVALPLLAAAAAGVAAWSFRAPSSPQDALVTRALGTYGTALALVIATAMARGARRPDARFHPAALAIPVALQLASLVVPVRLGRRRVA